MSTDELPTGTLHTLPDGRHEGTLTRTFPGHSGRAVWGMLTEQDKMAQWLAPGQIALTQGGAVKIDFADSGIVIESTVLELVPEQLLAYSWSSGSEPERPLRWALSDTADGARLVLTVTVPAGEDPAKACAGFEGHLDMLAAALEGVPIKFPFERFLQARAAYNQQLGH
ncbi:SRPBCC domain-containing protein [Castellaniella sp.]|uniref:SRPBCC domain-containing protein n=1 Tax=Castellaniella sp. TaxID=1955812 RepID=UPI00355F3979